MTRRTERVVIDAVGRDNGAVFVITEMSAYDGARWALRMILALTNGNKEIDIDVDQLAQGGFAAVALLMPKLFRLLAQVDPLVAQPLLDELLQCVQYQPAPPLPAQKLMTGTNCQIAEIATFYTLYWRTLALHVGFSPAADIPSSA